MKIINTIKQRDSRLVISCLIDKARTLQLDGPALAYLSRHKCNVMQGWRPTTLHETVRMLYACTITSQLKEGSISIENFARSLFSSQIREMFMVTAELLTNTESEDTAAVPYVPTNPKLINLALTMLSQYGPQRHTLIDLGCGDGRVLLQGAVAGFSNVVGYETNTQRATIARQVLNRYQQQHADSNYTFEVTEKNLLEVDYAAIGDNTVVFAYLMPDMMHRLEPLMSKAPVGTLIVTHDFQFPNWVPVLSQTLALPDKEHTLHLYEIGKHVETVIDLGKELTEDQLNMIADDLLKNIMGVTDNA